MYDNDIVLFRFQSSPGTPAEMSSRQNDATFSARLMRLLAGTLEHRSDVSIFQYKQRHNTPNIHTNNTRSTPTQETLEHTGEELI